VKIAVLTIGMASLGWAAGPQYDQAHRLYERTESEQSLRALNAIPGKDADVYALMGRNYFMLGDFKKASEALEKALNAQPSNSDHALWLGRAYGRRAETSGVFTAPGYASKTRQYLEKAAQLNPRNIEALNDLFEYYLQAPGFLGGGLDKAEQLAGQIARVDASEGYWARFKLAEQRKDYSHAEAQLRRAIEMAPQHIGKFIELARFLAGQGRYQEAEQSFQQAERIAPDSPRLMYARADLYIKTGRNLDTAKALLERYLNATLTPDDPPRAEAVKLLHKVRGG
jgi:cytochrome c-type biogenesis protein CcmH/NrfG